MQPSLFPDGPLTHTASTREAATNAEPASWHNGGGDKHKGDAAHATYSVQELERAALVATNADELVGAIPLGGTQLSWILYLILLKSRYVIDRMSFLIAR